MGRWLKIAAASAGGLILLLLAAAALAYGWLQTEGGRRWVEARIAAATDGQVRVEGLEGSLPFDAWARHVVIADARGPWLTGEQVRFSMRPAALLRLHAQIQTLSAERIEISRRPERDAQEQPRESGSRSPPRLPVSIELARLHAPEVLLARSVLGQAARLSLSGSGALSDGAARLDLTLRRLDAPGTAAVDLAYDGQQLALEAAIDDPRGLAASALGAQSEVPATLRASGAGPLRSWRGTVQASLGEAKSHISITIDDGRLTASGSLDPRPLLQPRIAALLPEPLRIEGVARIGEQRTLERIALASGATRLSFEGAVRLDDLTGSGEARLALPDAAVLQPLLDVPLQGAVSGAAVIDTTVEGQTAKLTLRGERLAAGVYSAEAVTVDATASRPREAEEFDVAGTVQTSGLAAERDAEGGVLPADLALSFDGALAPAAGRLVARRLSLTGEGAEIAFSGSAQRDGLLDGTVQISVPEVAPFARLAGLNWGGAATLDARLDASPGSGTTRFTIDGSWREPVTGIAALDPALGDGIVIAATGSARYDGALDFEAARVSSELLALSLSGRIAARGPLDARFELTASELGAFSAATPMAGSARINGRLTGTAAAPR
ncbi:MAG TPA: hypothetical protein VF031_08735, partial [Alphaproteobacteria bacterium]